jgi:hypothetical protein
MINILEYVNPLAFFIALCVGIFVVYISVPEPNIILKYPTPDNLDTNIYKDGSDTCYKYKAKEVDCKNYKNIQETKIQHIDEENKKKKPKSIFSLLKSKFSSK